MTDYNAETYWNDRYRLDETVFEWFADFSAVESLLVPRLKSASAAASGSGPNPTNVLEIGCGNSRLAEQLYDKYDVRNIVCVDFSKVVIDRMAKKHAKRKGLKYMQMDVRHLRLQDAAFDLIVDKGTFDCVLCGEEGEEDAEVMLSHLSRTLAPGGVYVVISHATPDNREHYFKKSMFDWDLQPAVPIAKPPISADEVLSKDDVYYAYVCVKRG